MRTPHNAVGWRDSLSRTAMPTQKWIHDAHSMATAADFALECKKYRQRLEELSSHFANLLDVLESSIIDNFDDFEDAAPTDLQVQIQSVEVEHEYLMLLLPEKTDVLQKALEIRKELWSTLHAECGWNNKEERQATEEADFEALDEAAEISSNNGNLYHIVSVTVAVRKLIDRFDAMHPFLMPLIMNTKFAYDIGGVAEPACHRDASE